MSSVADFTLTCCVLRRSGPQTFENSSRLQSHRVPEAGQRSLLRPPLVRGPEWHQPRPWPTPSPHPEKRRRPGQPEPGRVRRTGTAFLPRRWVAPRDVLGRERTSAQRGVEKMPFNTYQYGRRICGLTKQCLYKSFDTESQATYGLQRCVVQKQFEKAFADSEFTCRRMNGRSLAERLIFAATSVFILKKWFLTFFSTTPPLSNWPLFQAPPPRVKISFKNKCILLVDSLIKLSMLQSA